MGGDSIFYGVGVEFLLARLGMVELLRELGCWERKRGRAYYPRFGISLGGLRERIHGT